MQCDPPLCGDVYQRAVRRQGGQHMVGIHRVLPVAMSQPAKLMKIPDGMEIGLIERQDFHLGLGGRDRVVGYIDVQRADLEGVLEVLAA